MTIRLISEGQIADVLNPENAFSAVQDVFASMESEAWNFPVVRESLGIRTRYMDLSQASIQRLER